MDIKSDADSNFVVETKTHKNNLIWFLILVVGSVLMWISLMSPEVKGIVAFFVFFIGLNRVDAAIDYFRGITDTTPMSEKDIL
jgi:hypothetical protein